MDLKQLQLFLMLSQTNSFTRTGEILGYSQSNVSSQISQLESELGGPLFNRHGHSITLTNKGNQLLPYAEKMISLSNEAKKI